ncbi:transglycosylase SLT domain-containing protein [Halomonas sp. MCCC 1A11057]|uniref:transglycosylase SLT domain-containing protein n=2 Tax=Halomonadaceae TaxID=28256 RepID=UPI001F46C866|nr:transglycosylase SLT domain-containing protein [Halomonas sp. MCCC 1A11057]MCE8034620.1 transglycosylase SLT domain-containing protein [Halomonas sp. MCCC 1A11057]
MSEKIDSLLVELGLETDARSFRQAEGLFNNLRSAALKLGATVGGVATAHQMTYGFARANDVVGKFADNLGVSVELVDGLGHALQRSGGNATDAFRTIQSLTDLMAGIRMGDTAALEEAARWGFDPSAVLEATSMADALERIADATAGMSPMARQNVLNALGLGSQAEMTLLAGGSQAIRDYMAEAEQLAPMTRRHAELSAELNDETLRLRRAFKGLTDEISLRTIPRLIDATQLMTRMVSREEGESVEQFRERFGGEETDSTGRIANFIRMLIRSDDAPKLLPRGRDTSSTVSPEVMEALARVESGGRHRDASGNLTQSPAGALGRYQIMPATGMSPGFGVAPLRNDSEAEHRRFAEEYLSALLHQFDGDMEKALAAYNWGPGNVMQHGDDWRHHAPDETLQYVPKVLDELRRMPHGDLMPDELAYQPSPDELIPPGNRSELREGNLRLMRDQFPEQYQGNSQTHNWYITGTNAREIGEEVNRVLAQHASQAARDWQEPYA